MNKVKNKKLIFMSTTPLEALTKQNITKPNETLKTQQVKVKKKARIHELRHHHATLYQTSSRSSRPL